MTAEAMHSVYVVGDSDTVLAFAAGGVAGAAVSNAREARAAVAALAEEARQAGRPRSQPVLLLITKGHAATIRADLERLEAGGGGPLLLEIPGVGEPAGADPLAGFVRRVLGLHV